MPDDDAADPRELLAAFDASPYGVVLGDDLRRRRLVFEALAQSEDAMTREVGEQLFTGAIEPREVLRSSAYREFVRDALVRGEKMDIKELGVRLDALTRSGALTGDLERDSRAQADPKPGGRRPADGDDRR
ncbi:hypothetical protein ACWT_0390 [Actinoplanes sp. SE50]|uniref:hypothetical protein n=1 Tax=unclassified Actinoplanes TaxID=2626549 RepID=UPI00023EC558|nr:MULTISPECIES: hypothetical protein [unclassified Actinoplanes]AEV81402.1 hypothetical protein ACPL_505 [Actinoplanes sp. SE50/110]ATO79805.1 hypothetical protein ACWT_0390 [Actinoplanes sp. SE50]SLL97207.1 hypothetical protein ACSP50_0404 [Actinoplanes sp. SE50/110]